MYHYCLLNYCTHYTSTYMYHHMMHSIYQRLIITYQRLCLCWNHLNYNKNISSPYPPSLTKNLKTTTTNCATIPQIFAEYLSQLFVEQLSFRPENLVVQQQDFWKKLFLQNMIFLIVLIMMKNWISKYMTNMYINML